MTYSDHATLDLVFRTGAVYRYFAVPARVVDALRTAPLRAPRHRDHPFHAIVITRSTAS
jgi:hypothetical protein